jgi:2-polyprenyl-6-methoxyphenol hydroxylase-like FAD-dependent oxidoreductase
VVPSDTSHDVAIVGFGPVGQTLAALLGRSGFDVGVYERFPSLYNRPRAVRFDHEAMRTWQDLGLVEELERDILPVQDYEWFGADGEPLLKFSIPRGPSGWPHSYVFYQPYLEAALDGLVRSFSNVDIEQGWTMTGLTQHADEVELELHRTAPVAADSTAAPGVTSESRTVCARYVIGADGANSAVRRAAGIPFEDLGFSERWISVDVRPFDMSAIPPLETSRMYCDPRRPHVNCPNGRTHRRWEWMLLDGETADDFRDPTRVWSLLSQWLSPDQAELVRYAVYEFQCGVTETMRSGRCLLAGDAAHLMPPHMGEGLCTGLRDTRNLWWKLDRVLRGAAGDGLLDTYTRERLPHSLAIVKMSEQMGRVSCELDPERAAERDAQMRAAGGIEQWPFPVYEEGLIHSHAGSPTPLAGQLSVQGTVAIGDEAGRFDDVVGRGFTLVSVAGDPDSHLTSAQIAFLDELGAHRVALGGEGPGGARDVDGELTQWLTAAGVVAVLIRPDFYVFGSAREPEAVGAVIDDLRDQLAGMRQLELH